MSNSLVYQLKVACMYCEKYRQYDKTLQTWSLVNALEAWNYRDISSLASTQLPC